jgi:hypothetical protein
MKITITENQIRLIISESKKDILINKIGLLPQRAEFLDEICGSLSVWMANKFIDHLFKIFGYTDIKHKEEIIKQINQTLILFQKRNEMNSIMDWIRVGLNGNLGEHKNDDYATLYRKSHEWHNNLKQGRDQINYVEKNKVIRDYRKDGSGYYWVDLKTNDSSEECDRMGHCGRTSYSNTIYSLRETTKLNDKHTKNKSHLTAAIGKQDGKIYQLKGPNNTKPKEMYHPYIIDLLMNDNKIKGFGSEYDSSADFKLSDLKKEEIENIYKSKPKLFDSRHGKKILMQYGIISKENFNNIVKVKISPDDVHKWIEGDYVVRDSKEKNQRIYFSEALLNGDFSFIYEAGYDKNQWRYYLNGINKENKTKIIKLLKSFTKKNGDKFIMNNDLEELIDEYDTDDDIKQRINWSLSTCEENSYYEYALKQLTKALSEYGKVNIMYDEGVEINIDLDQVLEKSGLDEEDIDNYFDNCSDDPECVITEIIGDYYDKPTFRIDDRWSPDIDDDLLNDDLSQRLDDL